LWLPACYFYFLKYIMCAIKLYVQIEGKSTFNYCFLRLFLRPSVNFGPHCFVAPLIIKSLCHFFLPMKNLEEKLKTDDDCEKSHVCIIGRNVMLWWWIVCFFFLHSRCRKWLGWILTNESRRLNKLKNLFINYSRAPRMINTANIISLCGVDQLLSFWIKKSTETRRNNKARGEERGAINHKRLVTRWKIATEAREINTQYTFHLEVRSGAHSWSLVVHCLYNIFKSE